MEISNKRILVGGAVILIIGAAIGRFSLPAKVEIKVQEKIVEKEVVKWKTDYSKNENKDREYITIETRLPDGTIRKERRLIDKGTVRIDDKKESESTTEKVVEKTEEKTVEYAKNEWMISVLAAPQKGVTLGSGIDYGLSVQRRIIGPFYLGGFGMTNKMYGASLGFSW